MKNKSDFAEMIMAFFVCTACITILEGVMGMIFFPDELLPYKAFLAPPVFGLLSVLFGVVTWSKKELTVKQVLFRRGIHLLLIEAMVFGLNYAAGTRFPVTVCIGLFFGIAAAFISVYVILWLNDRKSAEIFNQKLKDYQKNAL